MPIASSTHADDTPARLFATPPAIRRLRLLGIAAFVIVGWIALQLSARSLLIADELRYIPPGYSSLIATGTVRQVWTGIDQQFGRVLREPDATGQLFAKLRKWHAALKTHGVRLGSVADLAAFGLDVERGVLVARYGDKLSLTVVRVRANDRLTELLTALSPGDLEPKAAPPLNGLPITEIGDNFVLRPEPTVAVISNNHDLIRLSIEGTAANVHYAVRNDLLFEGVRAMREGLLTGSSSLFVVPTAPAPVRRAWGIVQMSEDRTEVLSQIELQSLPWKALRQFFMSPPRLPSWTNRLPADIAAGSVIQDAGISDYIRQFAESEKVRQVMQLQYGGVLWELQNVPNLQRVSVVATGYRDGVPNLLMGVWGDASGLEKLILTLRKKFRTERDVLIMTKAMESIGTLPATTSALESAGALVDEPGALFDRYSVQANGLVPPPLDDSAFGGNEYKSSYGSATIRYLLPPITANDLKYRPGLKALADLRGREANRYRIAVTAIDNTYWFATDGGDLERLIDAGTPSASLLEESRAYQQAAQGSAESNHLQLFLNMDRIVQLGMLSPDSAIHEGVKQYLWDLRDHPSAALTVGTDASSRRIYLRIRLIPRRALLQ